VHVAMAALSVDRLARLPWPWRFGLGVPLLLGLVLAIGVAVSWLTGSGYEPPEEFEAGAVTDYAIAEPKLFEDDDVWLVRLPQDGFVALYDRGLESGCPLQWRRDFSFLKRMGWFVDACNGAAYDLTGRCFSDPCRSALLDRFAVNVEGGNVTVQLRLPERDLPADANATPLNPPAE
jgi:nitrite reductase/ring-hydroxylating ferredoxin subunit